MILPEGVEHLYAVDCRVCDECKGDDAALDQHLAAVSRADAAVEVIAAKVQAATERKNAHVEG